MLVDAENGSEIQHRFFVAPGSDHGNDSSLSDLMDGVFCGFGYAIIHVDFVIAGIDQGAIDIKKSDLILCHKYSPLVGSYF